MTLIDPRPPAPKNERALDAAFSGELRQTLGLQRQDLVAIAKMAQKAQREGDTALAFRAHALLVLVDPQAVAHQVGLAESALAAKNPSAALQAASAIVATAPENPEGYLMSARACLDLGLVEEAKEDLADALRFAKRARRGDIFAECQALLATLP
ncbi:MAG: hypothetical protein AAF318_01360 [Pseudomonadota bacterium]